MVDVWDAEADEELLPEALLPEDEAVPADCPEVLPDVWPLFPEEDCVP